MKGINRFKLLSIILVMAYLLSACSGAAPQSVTQSQSGSGKPQAMEVAFTGTVEAVSANSITVNGQTVSIDARTLIDANIKVGDIVKVEAQVSETGAVLALKVETSAADDTSTNPSNANDNITNTNANTNDNSNASSENGNVNSNDNSNTTGTTEQEIVGVVGAISDGSVTVDGVTYQLTATTELKDAIAAGDTVKLHLTVNTDGSLTVREIEMFGLTGVGDDNSNNSNSNVNDDNGNDDNDNDDNSNDDNSNDDDHEDDDDSGSNSNGNGNGG